MENENIVKGNFNSLRDVVEFIWRLRFWIVGGAVVALIAATIVVKLTTPIYKQDIWVMLNDAGNRSPEMDILSGFSASSKRMEHFDNEMFILTSPSMMRKVVEELNLNNRYFWSKYSLPLSNKVTIRQHEYYGDSPYTMDVQFDDMMPDAMRPNSIALRFKNFDKSAFSITRLDINHTKVKLDKSVYKYDDPINVNGITIVVNARYKAQLNDNYHYSCSWSSPASAASGFVGNLSAQYQNNKTKSSDVIILSCKDACIERAKDILNTLIDVADREAKQYANIANEKALRFLDERLESLASELGNAEKDYSSFQTSQSLVDLSSQTEMAISADQRNEEQLKELRLQIEIIQLISDYLSEQGEGKYSIIPENMGVSDLGLNDVIHSFNMLVTERDRMVSSSSENNPKVLTINSQLDGAKKSMLATVVNLQKVYSMREAEVSRSVNAGKRKIASIPTQQLQIQKLGRKLNIIEPLYQMLQQKREEVQITMYSQPDNYRVLESAFGSSAPVSPDRKKVYLIALVIGLMLAPGYFWIKMTLRSKVETKSDISGRLDVPVIAVLPKVKNGYGNLLPMDGRDPGTESFRMLRTNLQFLPKSKVFQVTSSISGEGKSFVSSNLALSLAHLEKKVLLMGMDIRKPVLGRIFDIGHSQVKSTLVSYLLGNTEDLDSLVNKTRKSPNLDIIFGGPVPPNPLELLSHCDFRKMIDYFREKYDYIIIDSAPYFPVSDSTLINPFVDATLYVVRANYTDLRVLDEIKEAINDPSRPLKNVNVVLNDFNLNNFLYGYGYYHGGDNFYGYGYGYGYGYDYGADDERKFHNLRKKKNGADQHIDADKVDRYPQSSASRRR